ncbi:hypothetical protein Pan241w_29150 [Gimesia alba]|uniref:Uncharacterized protein n=1 Tax=Gimesia alba TaxID=2527973 RepID=A0A517RG18_9PLAN|nr:hypothetical protein Pan241w_29150 [Gimesia alba]
MRSDLIKSWDQILSFWADRNDEFLVIATLNFSQYLFNSEVELEKRIGLINKTQ